MSEFEAIPRSAFEGIKDAPAPDMYKQCFSCGHAPVTVMSIGQCATRITVANKNTFLVPGVALGYVQCDQCEAEEALSKATEARRWWPRFKTWIGVGK